MEQIPHRWHAHAAPPDDLDDWLVDLDLDEVARAAAHIRADAEHRSDPATRAGLASWADALDAYVAARTLAGRLE